MTLLRRSLNLAVVNKQLKRTLTASKVAVSEETVEGKPWKEIPGPSRLPVVGHLHHFLPGGSLSKQGVNIFDLLADKYGPIVKFEGTFGSSTLIFVFDAEAASHVLRSENMLPYRLGFQSLNYFRHVYNKKDDGPTGLLTDYGETWKNFRSTVNHIMLQPKIIRLYSNSLSEVAEEVIARIKSIRDKKNELESNFGAVMNLWALESIGIVALGGRLNCFDPNLPADSPAKKLIQCVHGIFDITLEIDIKPSLWRYVATPKFKKAMKLYSEQMELSKFFIEKAIKEHQTGLSSLNGEKGVLEKLLEIDENVAVIMASDMLLAGVDTTANTIIGALYLLASNQDKQNKLREEIMSKEEKRPYLRACIKEALRILPVVSGNVRMTTKEYNLFGYKIPKDMNLAFAHHRLSMTENQFPRTKEFIPERWIADKSDSLYYGNAHPFAYNPFGFGTRSCIGRRIAELEIEILLSKFIEHFQVEWNGPPLKINPTTLNYAVKPYNFVFKDVK